MNLSKPPPLQAAAPPGQSRYGALAGALRARIVAGEWPPGSALPAEQALATHHGVALGTLRQALALLVDAGLVDRVHGKGTFVRAGLGGAPMLRFFRFGSTGAGVSNQVNTEVPSSRILSRRVATPPALVRQALGLADVAGRIAARDAGALNKGTSSNDAPATALQLRRVRSLNGVPRLVETIWLALPACAALQHSDTATWGDLLYPLLARACGVHVQRATDQIGFGQLNTADAACLQLPTGHPCANVQRLAYDLAGHCVEWRSTRGDANAFQYTVSIT